MTAQEEKSDSTAKKASKPKLGQPSASEESASPYPNMELCQQIHKLLVKAEGTEDGKLQIQVLNRIREELENPALYESVESSLGVTTGLWSAEDLAAQKVNNQKTVKDLEKEVEDAKESAGDMEVMDARVKYARFAAKSLTEEEALEAYKMLLELPKVSSGKKIDAVMESSRVASFYGNSKKSSESIDNVSDNQFTCLVFNYHWLSVTCILSKINQNTG
jgi:26S proteasome regulatory subunit N7